MEVQPQVPSLEPALGSPKSLCANVTETAPLVEMTVEGEQERDHVVEHVQEERHRPSPGGNGVRSPGSYPFGGSGESHLPRTSEAPELCCQVQAPHPPRDRRGARVGRGGWGWRGAAPRGPVLVAPDHVAA